MNKVKLILSAGAASLGLAVGGAAWADAPAAPPQPTPMPNPAMTAPLTANPNPATFDAGPFGKIMVDGVLSAATFWQSNPQNNVFGHPTDDGYIDISNAQVIINKTDGVFQFYVQAGAYDVIALGAPYYKADRYPDRTFGFVPQGFVKIVPNSNFSIEVGALPTLIGGEYTFSFQNMNIERGLLWGQEPAVSKGVQVNFTNGPFALSVAYTDGYYSDVYTALSGLLTYTFKSGDTLAFAAEGSVSPNRISTFVTPPNQNNGQIYNILFSHSQGPWTISPYLQFTNSQNVSGSAGHGLFFVSPVAVSGQTWGFGVLSKYGFTSNLSIAGRIEYIDSSGQANLLGFGPGSSAWSFTITPTYQMGVWFARGEASYVTVGSGVKGLMFGPHGANSDQARLLLETGFIF